MGLNGGRIVILTGAGISKASGIPTYRDKGGIWTKHHVEEVATPQALASNPVAAYGFFDNLRDQVLSDDVEPNAAHYALARLEQEWQGQVTIITQNIDDLHERGGSQNVFHMHGEVLKARCTHCGHVRTWKRDLDTNDLCDVCDVDAALRPHVVLFGEMPLCMNEIEASLRECDLFITIGSSLDVYPAAGFVDEVNARTVELNLEPSSRAEAFDEAYYGPAEAIVPVFVGGLLNGKDIENI